MRRSVVIVVVTAVITLGVGAGIVGQTTQSHVPIPKPVTNRLAFDNELVAVTKPRIVAASASFRCGSDVYTVSTGTNGGNCVVHKNADGSVASIVCTDGANAASASCNDKSVGSCDGTVGAGGCAIK